MNLKLKNKTKILFFGRSNCYYTMLMIKFLKNQNIELKVILSKARNQNLKKKQLNWRGEYIISFRSYFILPLNLLKKASIAAINFHPASINSRGSGGVNYSLYNNEKKYGVVAHIMNNKLDNGFIIDYLEFQILKKDNIETLLNRAYKKTFIMFKKVLLSLLEKNLIYLTKQIKYYKKKKIKFQGSIRKINQIDKMQEIKKNYSKNKINKIIKAFHTSKFPVYVKLYNYKFYLKI